MFRILSDHKRRVSPPRATFKPQLEVLEKRTLPDVSTQTIFLGTQMQLIQDAVKNMALLALDQSKVVVDSVKLQLDQQILKTPFAGTLGVNSKTLVSDQVRLFVDQQSVLLDLRNVLFDLNVMVNGTLQPPTSTPPPTNDPDHDGDVDMY